MHLLRDLPAEPEGTTEATPRSNHQKVLEWPPTPHSPRPPAWDSGLGSRLATGRL